MEKSIPIPEIGEKVYVDSHFYISHGSDDVVGGLATVKSVKNGISAGKPCIFISVHEHPGHEYNWSTYLYPMQEELKKEFKNNVAYPDPDIDTPWIQDGDIVNGEPYHGPDIW